jgi:hypothetical protein
MTLLVTAWRRPDKCHSLLNRDMTQCALVRIREFVSHFSRARNLRQRNCLPRPTWSVPRERGLEELTAQEAVLETAARAALPVLRDVSACSRQRDGWGTAPLAENVRESGQMGGARGVGIRRASNSIGNPRPSECTVHCGFHLSRYTPNRGGLRIWEGRFILRVHEWKLRGDKQGPSISGGGRREDDIICVYGVEGR